MFSNPKNLSDDQLRNYLEVAVNILEAAINEEIFPPNRPSLNEDSVKDPSERVTRQMTWDFSISSLRSWLFTNDHSFTDIADEARRRAYDPARRRLANNIDDLVCKLADKVRVPGQKVTANPFRPGLHL